MKKVIKKYYLIFILPLLLLTSCREEILPTENFAGNVNEPVINNLENSYSFVINAENLTQSFLDYTYFSINNVSAYFYLIEHKSGNAAIRVLDNLNKEIINHNLTKNTRGTIKEVVGVRAKTITINFKNFTGKLKVTLSGK